MGRDHRKLRVFNLADDLVLQIYHITRDLPSAERFGVQAQLRRAAVSAASNIVEGCARRTTGEYVNLLSVSNGSAAEARYLTDLSRRLGFAPVEDSCRIVERYSELMKGLQCLIRTLDTRPRA